MMDRHQVRFALLKITAMVLLGSTWVFWSFVYATRPEQAPAADPLTALMRLPASLPAVVQPSPKVLPPIEMNVAAVKCWDMKDEAERQTGARWVRITGKPCQLTKDAEKVFVKNLANGYAATVFESADHLTTDFIPLQPGKNPILVRFESAPGVAVESRFVFNRQ